MSREDVEIVRELLEAFERRDVEAILERWHTDAQWRPGRSPGGLEGITYVGHEGVRRWLAELAETWPTFDVLDPRIEPVGDRVLVLGHARVRGSASGVELDVPLAQLWEVDEGKTRRLTGFLSHAEALKAAALPPDPDE